MVAQAIHSLSKRSSENFIAVNCAALTDTLLESELFGHVKGAFTNAIADKKGRFEVADKGTIFLDEIGETSENFQTKLLRVLQTGEFDKVGSSQMLRSDVRVIAATNKNLTELVKQRQFREDLYYRLNVFMIEVPSLRSRKEDIEVLANHFLVAEESDFNLSKAVLDRLNENDWKGNVRELESVIKRAVIFAKSDGRNIIKLSDLPEELIKHDKSNLEQLILDSLREKKFSHSSINETAKELGGLSRTIIAENFRGIFFKTYVQNEFNLKAAISRISRSDDKGVYEKVESKVTTYLSNLEKDLKKIEIRDFDRIKITFSSKYKNLPQKYHKYLDEVIQHLIA